MRNGASKKTRAPLCLQRWGREARPWEDNYKSRFWRGNARAKLLGIYWPRRAVNVRLKLLLFRSSQQRWCQSRSRIQSYGDGSFHRQLPWDNNANYSWSRWGPMRYLKKTSIPFTCRPFLESQYSVAANTHVETSLHSPCDTTSLTGLINVFPFSSHSPWKTKKTKKQKKSRNV